MKKLCVYSCFIVVFIFKYNSGYSQIITVSTGSVESYAYYHPTTAAVTLVDTINGQYRSIAIDTIGKKIGITYLVDQDSISIQYTIDKIYRTKNYNSITKRYSNNLNILTFDSENYPLLVMISIDLKTIYLYYYWNSKSSIFMKSEKIAVTKRKNIMLH